MSRLIRLLVAITGWVPIPEVEVWKKLEAEARQEATSLRKELEACEHKLYNLLAVIHRDGGHYIYEVGLENACEDAMQISSERIGKLEVLKEAAKKLLEWCPVCSVGSSGYIRQENLRKEIA